MVTVQEFTTAFKSVIDDEDSDFYSNISEAIYEASYSEGLTLPGVGIVKSVFEERTGYDFDDYMVVLKTEDGQHFAIHGYYDSHEGVSYDDAEFEEVEPVEKTIVDWVSKK